MEDYDESPIVIDGYSSVQAIRRSQKRTDARPPVAQRALPSRQDEGKSGKQAGAKIDHTVIPQKHEVVCYECEYVFMVSGSIKDTMCPKCHRSLRMEDLAIDGKWTESIRTIGTVNIKAETILEGAEIRARDIILAGNAENGIIRAGRKLELHKGAKFNIAKTRMMDLVIRKGADFAIPATISLRNLEVEGTLKARVFADGVVVIKRGAILDGELHTPHLVVEDGGGLKAQVVSGIRKDKAPERTPERGLVSNNK